MPKQVNTLIPLLCDLCPKKPRFSDVSHLLTHISSKSHLSNRFKLQIRSQAEPEAKRLLAEFDSWYTDNGLEDLLSERLAAKDQKKTTKRTRLPSILKKSNVKAEMKAEMKPETKPEMKAEVSQDHRLAETPIYRPPIPCLHSWSTDPLVASFAEPPRGTAWTGNTIYETPTMKRRIPNFTRNESLAPLSTGPAEPTPSKPDDTDDEAEKDGSKLKGVYWPGMDLFDSATAEMKRMRNQKKDGTALQQMKRSSAEIEPTEWIFNADGEFRRARDIFDESTESSPTKSVAVPTPKRRRGRKGALTEANANIPRLRPSTTNQPVKKAVTKRKLNAIDLDNVGSKKRPYKSRLGVPAITQLSPNTEDYADFRLTMGDVGKKRKLGVFRDTVERSPAHTESPLEDHRFDFSVSRPVIPGNTSTDIPQTSPTPVFRPVPMRFGGKENVEPGHTNRRLMSTAASGFHPDIFYSDSLNPLYTHSHAHAFSYGDRQSFQTDIRPGFSSYGGDFKPLMMTDPFRAMSESHGSHGLPDIPGPSFADNIRYGM